ncbi:MAG: ATP-binding protein [Verrucomicrobiota bacterium]
MHILVNLLRNAKDALDASGRPDHRLTVRVRQPDAEQVAVSIVDNGAGIAPENMPRLFDHGFTTRAGGHGFGLHSAAMTAEELGGSLSVRSDGPQSRRDVYADIARCPENMRTHTSSSPTGMK